MDDVPTKIEETREKLAPYADGVIDRAVAWVVAHPKTTLSIAAALFVLLLVAART
jgi:ElaB/YqjD/DUF883 family membrane-anchored ribosome-binding protein